MKTSLSQGGLGDCFITILKILEHEGPLLHTHVDNDRNQSRLELSKELLGHFNIENKCYTVSNIRQWWYANRDKFDKHFNVMAKGYINIPLRPYHWQPCRDEGYKNPFSDEIPEKKDLVAVQVDAGMNQGNRNHHALPLVEYVENNYDKDKVLWFGTDKDFSPEFGTNYSGRLDFIPALEKIKECSHFVGFPSMLLYWSLWHKTKCFIFTDHQDRHDLRIHDDWKEYLSLDIDI